MVRYYNADYDVRIPCHAQLILIKPVNDTLISMRQKAESHASTESKSETESGALLKRWVFLHNCRCALVCAGFAVGLGNVLGVFL